jgi:hypothetical protein
MKGNEQKDTNAELSTKKKKVAVLINSINRFFGDHGRMPTGNELGSVLDDSEECANKELVYELEEGEDH